MIINKSRIIKIVILINFVIMSLTSFSFAKEYDTGYYTIDIPNSYSNVYENSFKNEKNNCNVNIQIISYDSSTSVKYDNETLDSIINEYLNNNSFRDEIKDWVEKQYGNTIPANQKDELINTLSNSNKEILKKDIIKTTKNNYPCFHFRLKWEINGSIAYLEQYMFFSGNNSITLTVGAVSEADLDSIEIRDIVNSFTIKNYESLSSFYIKMILRIGIPLIGIIICSWFALKKDKRKKIIDKDNEETSQFIENLKSNNKENSDKTDLIKCRVCGKEINYNEHGTCEECHQKILKRIEEKKAKEDVKLEEIENDVSLEKNKIIDESPLSDVAKNKLKEQLDSISKKDILDIIELNTKNKDEENKRFCTNCGKELKPDWKFCNYCGHENQSNK